ncbi:hypothetical protein AX14_011435, partial [Amanita brunnescens Koide BX004]
RRLAQRPGGLVCRAGVIAEGQRGGGVSRLAGGTTYPKEEGGGMKSRSNGCSITLCGDFILTFPQVLDSDDHATLVKKLKKVYLVDVQVLNRGTTSLLKFPLVPTRHPDGSPVTNEWLHKTIAGHPKWQSVKFVQHPRFVIPPGKKIGFTATVFTEVADDHAASTAKRLLQTDVLFHTVPRRCKPWSVSMSAKQCG